MAYSPLESTIKTWRDIDTLLTEWLDHSPGPKTNHGKHNESLHKQNTAFITYDYGIDGVTIEISKYARCLEELFRHKGKEPVMHFIGGTFFSEADKLLKPEWHRLVIDEFNGWDKWDEGVWFKKLFYEDMPEDSEVSHRVAQEIWHQATAFARQLCEYITENEIGLVLPVNVNSNPGNIAASLAVVLATELTGTSVVNSNHDFYWEGGKPLSKRTDDEPPGVRDHFFKNYENRVFFSVFKKLYPWNGKHWQQLTINHRQKQRLETKYNFSHKRVNELNTAVSDAFFTKCSIEEKVRKRLTMAYILTGGNPLITPVPISRFLRETGEWLENQVPILCGYKPGLTLNIAGKSTWYFLQPTRVIPRKCIHHNLRLIEMLLTTPEIRREFEQNSHRTLVLHITGPVPVEHEGYLRRILRAYQLMVRTLPEEIANRVFIAFSAGHDSHPTLEEHGLRSLHIRDIYQLADVVVFPSETEGRGLPLIEAGATGVPILSRRYRPHRVFDEVVGVHLAAENRIQYIPFPGHRIPEELIPQVVELLMHPETADGMIRHNRKAVAKRYSMDALKKTFCHILKTS
jgi:glycosyltransferase involved in cell wall biosynthesis